MNTPQIVAELDKEIERLTRARRLLSASDDALAVATRATHADVKRIVSEATRKRLSEAMSRKWAERKVNARKARRSPRTRSRGTRVAPSRAALPDRPTATQ